METEYEYCSLEGQMPDPTDADISFDFLDYTLIAKAEIFTAAKDLAGCTVDRTTKVYPASSFR